MQQHQQDVLVAVVAERRHRCVHRCRSSLSSPSLPPLCPLSPLCSVYLFSGSSSPPFTLGHGPDTDRTRPDTIGYSLDARRIASTYSPRCIASTHPRCLYVRGACGQPRVGLDASTPQPRHSLDTASTQPRWWPRRSLDASTPGLSVVLDAAQHCARACETL